MTLVHKAKAYGGSRGIAPVVRNLSTRQRRVIELMLLSLYPQGSNPRYAFSRRLCRPQSRPERCGGSETPCACRESSHDSSIVQPAAWSLYHVRYSGSFHSYRRFAKPVIQQMFHILFLCTSPRHLQAFNAASTLVTMYKYKALFFLQSIHCLLFSTRCILPVIHSLLSDFKVR